MILSGKFNFVLILTVLMLINANSAVNSDKKSQDAKCLLPMEPGPCRISLTRFYYNAKTDTCEEFKFGGCNGNDNKFGFKLTCEAACKVTKSAEVSKPTSATTSTLTATPTPTPDPTQLKSDTVNGVATATKVTATTTKPQAAPIAITKKPAAAPTATVKSLISSVKDGITSTTPKLTKF